MRRRTFGEKPDTGFLGVGAVRSVSVVDDLLHEAMAKQFSGRLAEAAEITEGALRYYPGYPEALLRLGVIRAQQGKLEAAATLLTDGLIGNPGSAEGYNNLGRVLHDLGRSTEAVAAYERAVVLRPGYATALNNRGAALAALGRHEEAIASYDTALAVNPVYVEALSNLGASLHAVERVAEAIERFRAALSIRPAFVDARLNLGHALAALDRIAEAIICYETVLKARPDDTLTRVALADALRRAGRSREAAEHYQQVCTASPDLAPAHAGLANVYLELGRLAEARRHAETALSIEPHRPSYFHTLTRAKKLAPTDPHLGAMLELAVRKASLEKGEAVDLQFALGKALSDIGRDAEAFEHLLDANKLKRETVTYNETATLASIDRTREVFTPRLIKNRAGQGDPSSIPIFILGMPRSGSTLVEQILASHPKIFGAGEISAFRSAMGAVGLNTRARAYPDSVADCRDQELRNVGVDYLSRLIAQARADGASPPTERICDKMLDNFRYAGLIHLALPNARIIHTRRDPIDTCLSCFSIQFAKLAFTNDLGELGRHYHAYAKLMNHWHETLPPGTIHDVQYEDLVENFDEEARRLVAFCGLDWDENCARFYETKRSVRTASLVQVRRPIYRDSIRRWRPSDEELRPLLEGLKGVRSGAPEQGPAVD